MNPQQLKYALLVNRIPLWGIIIFFLIFYCSSHLYPGGSQANLSSVGFDWVNNYWCNLLNENGMNGEINEARPWAIFGMIVLCFSLSVFFYQFAEFLSKYEFWNKTIKITGIISMIFAAFIFTKYHDLMILFSSLSGLVAIAGLVVQIYDNKLTKYMTAAIICLILLTLNNVIYYSSLYIEWLPLIQKITFLTVLIWILGMNHEIRKRIKTKHKITLDKTQE